MSKKVTKAAIAQPQAKTRAKKRPMTREIRVAILDGAWQTMFEPRYAALKAETEQVISAYIAEKVDLEKVKMMGKALYDALGPLAPAIGKNRESFVLDFKQVIVNITVTDNSRSCGNRLKLTTLGRSRDNHMTPFSSRYFEDRHYNRSDEYFTVNAPFMCGFGEIHHYPVIGIHDGNYRRSLEAKAKASEALTNEANEFCKILCVALKNAKYVDDFLAQFPAFEKLVPAEQAKTYPIALIPDADRLNSLMKKYKPQDVSANA